MRETDYAYAVARIRANENALLTRADIDQLIAADSYDTAVRILTDKGWAQPEGEQGFDICENEMSKTVKLISECVPDASLFDALVIANDFANLKAAIKAEFSAIDAGDYMTAPYLCDPAIIIKAVKESDFSLLPDYLAECAEAAYHTFSDSQSGQLIEVIIDKACNRTKTQWAVRAESPLLEEIFEMACAVSDIKTARRCVTTGKSREFALDAVSFSGRVDCEKLVDAAYAGEKLASVISDAGLEELAEYADGDFTALEMRCDNLITEMAGTNRHEIFGADPVVAYYYAKVAEVKNVRIVLSAKAASVPKEIISERVRDTYV